MTIKPLFSEEKGKKLDTSLNPELVQISKFKSFNLKSILDLLLQSLPCWFLWKPEKQIYLWSIVEPLWICWHMEGDEQ